MRNGKVQILDTTLREGEQTPGVSFKISQKIEIVKLLNRFGVDFIEVGHPIVSKDIHSFIEKVSNLNLDSKEPLWGVHSNRNARHSQCHPPRYSYPPGFSERPKHQIAAG